ncbi:MAG: protein-L-isoaspartate(D-aspartate) O-methyltransferase [Acidobacteriota bacterium]|nr:protein-L-isoaspartate(D-aspartate) O-methyltransferase [Acidobacteriota bacterium]
MTASVGVGKGPVRDAFAATPREHFVGPGPWKVTTGLGYIETPSDDPAFLYQDILIALTEGGSINNGQPSLHALCLSALDAHAGETVIHVGAGTGYYTALLAKLVGPEGELSAYEVDRQLAGRARTNLAGYRNVTVHARSGSIGPLPACDILYVNAGATAPLDVWLDALRPRGRLLFPLTPEEGFGAMLLITRIEGHQFRARSVSRAMFIPCVGARDEDTARKLSLAFKNKPPEEVRSLRRNASPDETCWIAGKGWWLSTAPPA